MKMIVAQQQKVGLPAHFIYFDGSGNWWECRGEQIEDDMKDQTVDCQVVTPQHAFNIMMGSQSATIQDFTRFIECLLENDPRSMKL